MRLIDADVFKTEYENLITWVSHRAEKARLREFIKDIQNQPTVQAIPIERIKRYIAEEGIYPNRELLSVEQADAIERMIENWEKENGTE